MGDAVEVAEKVGVGVDILVVDVGCIVVVSVETTGEDIGEDGEDSIAGA